MVPWVFLLTTSVAEGFALALRHPCGIAGDTRFLETISDETLRQAPEKVGALVAHLLEGTPTTTHFFGLRRLPQLFAKLRQAGTPKPVLNEVLEQALRLGVRGTETW